MLLYIFLLQGYITKMYRISYNINTLEVHSSNYDNLCAISLVRTAVYSLPPVWIGVMDGFVIKVIEYPLRNLSKNLKIF